MADLVYTSFKRDIANGGIDLDTDTVNVMLVTSAYTPSAAHAKRSDVTGEVANGNGYATGGLALAGKTVTNVGSTGVFDANDPTWSASTITARGAVIYKATGVAANDPLVCYLDFGADKSSSNGNFTINFNAGGIVVLN